MLAGCLPLPFGSPLFVVPFECLGCPQRRPPARQVPLPPDPFQDPVADPVLLSQQRFLRDVRGGRRGAVPGPSGCTAEHLRVLTDDEDSADLLMWAAGQIASGAATRAALAADSSPKWASAGARAEPPQFVLEEGRRSRAGATRA